MKVFEILLVLICALYAIVNGLKWKKINRVKKLFVFISFLTAFVISINQFKEWQKENLIDRVSATFGDIKDLKGATIPIIKLGPYGTKAASIILNNGGVLGFKDPYDNLMKVYIKENRLNVNVVLRDLKGKVIAVIDKNEWTIFGNEYEYNNDDTGFELVTNGDRKVMFQIDLKEGIAHISGLIINEKEKGFYIHEDPKSNMSVMIAVEVGYDFQISKENIKPLFKYPRGKYIGLRSND